MNVTENTSMNRPYMTECTNDEVIYFSKQLRAVLITVDLSILSFNLVVTVLVMYTLIQLNVLKKKPLLSLLFYLCLSDCSFAVTAQTLFAIKLFHPKLPRLYNMFAVMTSTILADLSLIFVVYIAIARYIHTRYMIPAKQIITRTRVNIAAACGFVVAVALSTISFIAESYTCQNVHLVLKIFGTFVGVVLVCLVVVIYICSELVAKRRTTLCNYVFQSAAYSEKVLHKIMLSTLFALLPLRIPYFCSAILKATLIDKQRVRLSWWIQTIHLTCYAVYCLNPAANSVIFLYNNKRASSIVRKQWVNCLTYVGRHGNCLFIYLFIYLFIVTIYNNHC